MRERTDKLVRELVLDDAAPFAPHTRCADELNEARWSQNISKTAAFLNRSNRFHTLFHLPKRFGSARQVMMQRFQKQPILTALGAASRQRRAEHRNRRLPIQFRHCRGHADPPNQSAIHESR
jgi:hypothetical protein